LEAETTLDPSAPAGASGALVRYSYDAWGHVSGITYPGAAPLAAGPEVLYENDVSGAARAVSVRAAPGQVPRRIASLVPDPLGRRGLTLFASGASNAYTYDADGVAAWRVSPVGADPFEYAFSRDALGRISGTGEWDLEGDALGRLLSAEGHGIGTLHGRDGFGNAVSHAPSAAPGQPPGTMAGLPPGTMAAWGLAPDDPKNRVPPETLGGAQTWWQYAENGEALWVGKAPGGGRLQLAWDGLGTLAAVLDGGAAHAYSYAPSGLRASDVRTGPSPRDRRFAYASAGLLLSVREFSQGQEVSRTHIVYANGVAIAEIGEIAEMGGGGKVFELHADRLGSPRHVTDGGDGQTRGAVVGGQAFGPYGERMEGAFLGKQLPWGYRPATGYTGHISEDDTGLIYMRGRYYSPMWHRFVNSDRGADPNDPNQYAYAGGRPFSATDPSGMAGHTLDAQNMTGLDFGGQWAWERFMAPIAAGRSPVWDMDLGQYMDMVLEAQFQAWKAQYMEQDRIAEERTRQIEEWFRQNAGALKAVYPLEGPLEGFIVGSFANHLPSHGAVLLEYERATFLVESKFSWFLNKVTMTRNPDELQLERFGKLSDPSTPLSQITAEMLYEWMNSRNAGWHWYVPCWPFPASAAQDCHTTKFDLMTLLGYDAAKPH
jgi:RHS repeat-associated protein